MLKSLLSVPFKKKSNSMRIHHLVPPITWQLPPCPFPITAICPPHSPSADAGSWSETFPVPPKYCQISWIQELVFIVSARMVWKCRPKLISGQSWHREPCWMSDIFKGEKGVCTWNLRLFCPLQNIVGGNFYLIRTQCQTNIV